MSKFDDEAHGTAIAAFTLAQMAFWHQINSGAMTTEQAAAIIQQAIEANATGGPANRKAAVLFQAILEMVLKGQRPLAH